MRNRVIRTLFRRGGAAYFAASPLPRRRPSVSSGAQEREKRFVRGGDHDRSIASPALPRRRSSLRFRLFHCKVCGAYAAATAAPALCRRRPQARERRGDQGFFDLLRHPRHAECEEVERDPDGDRDRRQSSPHRLHDRAGQGARSRKIFHHLHRCDRQRAHDLAEQFQGAAAHAVSEIHHARHGGVAISPGEGEVRHRSSRRRDRPVDGRHADPAMGRQPPRL